MCILKGEIMAIFLNFCAGMYVLYVCLAVGGTATKPHSHHHPNSQMCCHWPSPIEMAWLQFLPKIKTHPPTHF